MHIFLNGHEFPISDDWSVSELVARRELDPRQIAIEINHQIIRREDYGNVLLAAGDCVELVSLAGGG